MNTELQGNRDKLKQQLFELVSNRFQSLAEAENLNKQALADSLGQSRIDVERMLASPKYWTLDILADLLSAMNSEISFELNEHSCTTESAPRLASNT